MDYYGVGRVTPGYEINDNPATGGRSIGYGSGRPEVAYSADFTSWVQEDPASLKLKPLPPEGRVSPDFTSGRMVGYGADLPAKMSVPIVGTMMLGTLILGIVATYFVVKMLK